MIRNPILPGFNPDPSICRVGDDYYIATSTFEWFPGVQIHHSTNLVDWQLVARPLCRASQLDMRGNPDSGGIWAPCLSHADGKFWLVYTDVKRLSGAFKDAHNYIVTARDVTAGWSEPTYVNSSGFDPSLFHDDDGRKWFLNLVWNHRTAGIVNSPRGSVFGGIVLQEFDPLAAARPGPNTRHLPEETAAYGSARGALVGDARLIFTGSERGLTEGPHVFKREGWYYLVVAEGGTGYEHAVTHARSRELAGHWELHPDTPVITADLSRGGPLQRAGHGQALETPSGEWYHTHLCGRPLSLSDAASRRCPLGRETAIQKMQWADDGWLRLVQGGSEPVLEVEPPRQAGVPQVSGNERFPASSPVNDLPRQYTFDQAKLPIDFQWLRSPDWHRLFSLDARPGYLRLFGRESVGSHFEQSLVARRQQHLAYRATTVVDFEPAHFQQGAGLAAYYDQHRYHVLQITHDEELGRVLRIMSCEGDWPACSQVWRPDEPVPLSDGVIALRCEVNGRNLQFSWRYANPAPADTESLQPWQPVGGTLDASILSDEAGRGEHASFTGAFVGMLAFDISGEAIPADFQCFDYVPLPWTRAD